jgi:hypothetical protein
MRAPCAAWCRCQERLQAGLEFGRTVLLVLRLQSLPELAPAAQAASTSAAASSNSRWWWFGRRSSSPSGSSDVPTPSSSSSSSSSQTPVPGTEAAPAAPGRAAKGVQPPTSVEPAALQQLLELAVARLDESVAAARQVVGLVAAGGKVGATMLLFVGSLNGGRRMQTAGVAGGSIHPLQAHAAVTSNTMLPIPMCCHEIECLLCAP